MPRQKKSRGASNDSAANLGFEVKLWQAAASSAITRTRRSTRTSSLGHIFLKYISDSFDEHNARLVAGECDYAGANPEDKDEYLADSVFWVPKEARWAQLQSRTKLPRIGKDVDDAMVPLERDNPALKGVLPKDCARPALNMGWLGRVIDLMSDIKVGDEASRAKDERGHGDTYYNYHPADLKANVILANRPLNISDCGSESRGDRIPGARQSVNRTTP